MAVEFDRWFGDIATIRELCGGEQPEPPLPLTAPATAVITGSGCVSGPTSQPHICFRNTA